MIKKGFKIIILITIIIMTFIVTCYGADTDGILDSAKNFVDTGTKNPIEQEAIKNLSDLLYNILLSIGIIVTVIWAAVLGFQLMLGSVEEQANIKESLIPFLIGCIIIYGVFGIWKLIVTLLQNVT